MGRNSKIEWTEDTWNPITGCSKVSQGCKNCYAEREWPRLVHLPAYKGRAFTDVACQPERLGRPLSWTKPRMIFVNSMSDLFHEDVPDEFIDSVFGVMWACLWGRNEKPGHIFQVLTKRAERMRNYLQQDRRKHWATAAVHHGGGIDPDGIWDQVMDAEGPHPRIWLGVSVEDQAAADERIPLLLQTPAAVRWVSAEPLLGPVDLGELPSHSGIGRYLDSLSNAGCEYADVPGKLDWVVVGGESGHNARPMHPDWARSLRDQCAAAGVPFLFKQWGEFVTGRQSEHGLNYCYDNARTGGWVEPNGNYSIGEKAAPVSPIASEHVFKLGKKAAGRLLDGAQHDGYPE